MNIIILTNTFPSQENPVSGHFIYKRVEQLIHLGHQVEIVLVNHIRDKRLQEYPIEILGRIFRVHVINYLQLPFTWFQFGLFFPLKRLIKKYKTDIIHVHHVNCGYGAYLAHKRLSIPYVVTAHGSDIHTKLWNKKHFIISKKVLENSTQNIFVSEALKRIAQGFPIDLQRATVIHNGVSLPDIHDRAQEEAPGRFNIIYVGHLIDIKRVDHLVDIFELVKKKISHAFLTVVGDGDLSIKIQSQFAERGLLDSVSFTGQVENCEVYKLLQRSDILIAPSLKEGFGCVILEAQACGVQTVVSDNGGLPEAVGDVGLVIPETESWIDDFAEGIFQLYRHPVALARILTRARNFSWKRIIQKETSLYETALYL